MRKLSHLSASHPLVSQSVSYLVTIISKVASITIHWFNHSTVVWRWLGTPHAPHVPHTPFWPVHLLQLFHSPIRPIGPLTSILMGHYHQSPISFHISISDCLGLWSINWLGLFWILVLFEIYYSHGHDHYHDYFHVHCKCCSHCHSYCDFDYHDHGHWRAEKVLWRAGMIKNISKSV